MKEFLEAISEIKAMGDDDPECRHGAEDSLAIDFIREVADTGGPFSLKAKLLLEVLDEDVSRWYA